MRSDVLVIGGSGCCPTRPLCMIPSDTATVTSRLSQRVAARGTCSGSLSSSRLADAARESQRHLEPKAPRLRRNRRPVTSGAVLGRWHPPGSIT